MSLIVLKQIHGCQQKPQTQKMVALFPKFVAFKTEEWKLRTQPASVLTKYGVANPFWPGNAA